MGSSRKACPMASWFQTISTKCIDSTHGQVSSEWDMETQGQKKRDILQAASEKNHAVHAQLSTIAADSPSTMASYTKILFQSLDSCVLWCKFRPGRSASFGQAGYDFHLALSQLFPKRWHDIIPLWDRCRYEHTTERTCVQVTWTTTRQMLSLLLEERHAVIC